MAAAAEGERPAGLNQAWSFPGRGMERKEARILAMDVSHLSCHQMIHLRPCLQESREKRKELHTYRGSQPFFLQGWGVYPTQPHPRPTSSQTKLWPWAPTHAAIIPLPGAVAKMDVTHRPKPTITQSWRLVSTESPNDISQTVNPPAPSSVIFHTHQRDHFTPSSLPRSTPPPPTTNLPGLDLGGLFFDVQGSAEGLWICSGVHGSFAGELGPQTPDRLCTDRVPPPLWSIPRAYWLHHAEVTWAHCLEHREGCTGPLGGLWILIIFKNCQCVCQWRKGGGEVD